MHVIGVVEPACYCKYVISFDHDVCLLIFIYFSVRLMRYLRLLCVYGITVYFCLASNIMQNVLIVLLTFVTTYVLRFCGLCVEFSLEFLFI